MKPTLYQKVLQSRFANLHPVLQRFHASPTGETALCRLQVTHGAGIVGKLLATIFRLPPEQDFTEARLEVRIQGKVERWTRNFGQSKLVSYQKAAHSLDSERVGPMSFGLRIDIVNGGMRIQTQRSWFLGLPLPRILAPTVEATVIPNDTGWALTAGLNLPWFGRFMTYQGEVCPVWVNVYSQNGLANGKCNGTTENTEKRGKSQKNAKCDRIARNTQNNQV